MSVVNIALSHISLETAECNTNCIEVSVHKTPSKKIIAFRQILESKIVKWKYILDVTKRCKR